MTQPVSEFKPGLYLDVPDDVYHGDLGSLSSSGARKLLKSPAIFHAQLGQSSNSKVFDIGHAAHTMILGAGQRIVRVEAKDWRTNAAKEKRDAAYAANQTPLLAEQYDASKKMADKVLSHPIAGPLFTDGVPEASIWWQDPITGVMLRARPDWLRNKVPGRRRLIVDLKTAASSDPAEFGKKVADYGYHCQAPWYMDGLVAMDPDEEPAFVFVVVMKEPPHLVSVVQLPQSAMALGARLNRRAIDLYARCRDTGIWPGWDDTQIHMTDLPAWAYYQQEEILNVEL